MAVHGRDSTPFCSCKLLDVVGDDTERLVTLRWKDDYALEQRGESWYIVEEERLLQNLSKPLRLLLRARLPADAGALVYFGDVTGRSVDDRVDGAYPAMRDLDVFCSATWSLRWEAASSSPILPPKSRPTTLKTTRRQGVGESSAPRLSGPVPTLCTCHRSLRCVVCQVS